MKEKQKIGYLIIVLLFFVQALSNLGIRMTKINQLSDWSSAQKILISMGVPTKAPNHKYTHISLSQWTCGNGPLGVASIWKNLVPHFGQNSLYGSDSVQIRNNIKTLYRSNGVKLLISVFGQLQLPSLHRLNALICAESLANFVTSNAFDGVNFEYDDQFSFSLGDGSGQNWIKQFSSKLRELLPSHILIHSPKARFFKNGHYPGGGYLEVHSAVGSLIDYYNIRYYKEAQSSYNTYQSLFVQADGVLSGTAVSEIISLGIPKEKIIVGKQASDSVSQLGWMQIADLADAVLAARTSLAWNTGVYLDQYYYDSDSLKINTIVGKQLNLPDPIDPTNPPSLNLPIAFGYINTIRGSSWWHNSVGLFSDLGVPGNSAQHPYNYLAFSFWNCQRGVSTTVDIAKLWEQIYYWAGPNSISNVDNHSLQAALKKVYNDNGVKILVSAFGATFEPTTSGEDATVCAQALAEFVINNNLDGADIDWQESGRFADGTGELWLIEFTRALRAALPTHIITHAPQGPYFNPEQWNYPGGGYRKVHNQVGNLIDFYNIQFYNQGTGIYGDYNSLFVTYYGTAVKELIDSGIPKEKIVVGKPASSVDASNGYISPGTLGSYALRAKTEFGWQTGIMFWSFASDRSGDKMKAAIAPLLNNPDNPDNPSDPNDPNNPNNPNNPTVPNDPQPNPGTADIPRPIRFGYQDGITSWWPPSNLLAGLGLPGVATPHPYNYFSLNLWTMGYGAQHLGIVWQNPLNSFGTNSGYGSTNQQIRTNIKRIYNENGVKLLISAFGSTEFPAQQNFQPKATADALAQFIMTYDLDGASIDWLDTGSFLSNDGKGQNWLIAFSRRLRAMLPDRIIVHSPQALYFRNQTYGAGGYLKVHQEVGLLIDFYNVQFFNQGTQTYDTYRKLFTNTISGTSVVQLIDRGIPIDKIVVGKPANVAEASSGYVVSSTLRNFIDRAKTILNYQTGLALWDYYYDQDGRFMKTAMRNLIP